MCRCGRSRCSTSDVARRSKKGGRAAASLFVREWDRGNLYAEFALLRRSQDRLRRLTLVRGDGSAQDATPDKAKLEAGETVYNTFCAVCHGDRLVSTGQFPNLRRLTANDRTKFDTTVRNGRNQMPPWKDMLSDAEIDELWVYIRANANEK